MHYSLVYLHDKWPSQLIVILNGDCAIVERSDFKHLLTKCPHIDWELFFWLVVYREESRRQRESMTWMLTLAFNRIREQSPYTEVKRCGKYFKIKAIRTKVEVCRTHWKVSLELGTLLWSKETHRTKKDCLLAWHDAVQHLPSFLPPLRCQKCLWEC